MLKEQKTETKQQPQPRSSWSKSAIVLAIIIGLLLVVWGVSEFSYQHEVSAMKNGIENAKTDVADPASAVVQSAPTLTHGAHFIDKLACADVNCPQVESTWLVPLASDGVGQFVASVKAKIAEKESGDLFFDRSKWNVQIFPTPSDSSRAAPSGETWMSVHIFVTE